MPVIWFLRLLALLPLPLLRFLGGILGLLLGYVPGRRFRTAVINLRVCFPDRDDAWYRRMARRSLVHEACNLLEMPRLWRLPPARLRRLAVETAGLELLDQARAKGGGVVLITPHLGSWEFSGLYLSLEVTMHSLYRPLRHPAFDRFVRAGREHAGARLLPADRDGMRALLRALQDGETAGILPDHTPRRAEDGVLAPFFGVPASTATLASRLARRQNATMLAVRCLRRQGGFRLELLPADARVYAPEPATAAAGINATVEACIGAEVAQYWWSYPRFRKRRMEPPSLYD